MTTAGLFIVLYDEKTLSLYLDNGIYGFLMPPIFDRIESRSKHYAALADYACTREGTHVFFFLKRKIAYGGQIIGAKDYGAFYLNGPYSPMGRRANATVCWDESLRSVYKATQKKGIFDVPDVGERCQPYIVRFEDKVGLRGRQIVSDQLYFELGKYGYPLPSNSIAGMGFCTLTPGETDVALKLLREEPFSVATIGSNEKLSITGELEPFRPEYGIGSLKEGFEKNLLVNEAHLEASVLANPELLPESARPNKDTMCRQVPVSPFKPFQLDRADICYYSEDSIGNGTIPNTLIELKKKRAGDNAIEQIKRYLKWLYLIAPRDASRIAIFLLAPSFASSKDSLPASYQKQVEMIEITGPKS